MKQDRKTSEDTSELRRQAETRLRAAATEGTPARTEADTQRLVHELQVHQIELEMQNDELHQLRSELEAGLEQYTDLYDFAPVGYLTLDRDGTIRKVNLTGTRLLGVERARLVGRRFGIFVAEADRSVFNTFLKKVFANAAEEFCEVVLPKEGKGPINVDIKATLSNDGQECRAILVDITARKQAEEELRQLNLSLEQRVSERTSELAHTIEVLQEEISQRVRAENELKLANEQLAQRADQLRRLAGQLTMTEQAERKRLSKLLHDGFQQHLASAKIQLGGLAEQIENVDLKRTADEIVSIIGEGMSMSRSLCAELSPPILHEGGLSEGLKWLIRRMREKHRFSVDLSLGVVSELREDVKMLVFESVRELLFNALKHGQAFRAQVRLELAGNGEMRVTVSDEGAGFDPSRLLPAGDGCGFGLFSIRERIGLFGGRLEIDSAPGRGSRVMLTVPHYQADATPCLVDDVCAPVILPPKGAAEDQETTIRVLMVDDHALFRNAIARLLKNEPGLEVVGEAKDGQEAIEFAYEHKPNVILMDISMPGINGIEATRVIHERHPEVCIIGLSMYDDPEKERAMRAAGATDYRTKECDAADLVAAIREGLQTREPSSK